MPQELEVWYLIPAIRKELAKIFVKEYKLNQKQVSKILGVTESAVSQYLKSKRANELKFSKTELDKVKKTAEKIIKDEKNVSKYLFELTMGLRGMDSLCKLHRKQDKNLSVNCKICMKK
jgi:predicted transcriptional regulator